MIVSIPFKRERLSELQIARRQQEAWGMRVSIPFKRERLSEL